MLLGLAPLVRLEVGERDWVREGERVGVTLGVRVPLALSEPVALGLAPSDSAAVGEGEAVGERVALRVPLGVPVPDWEGVRELEGLLEALAPAEREAVGVREVVLDPVSLRVGVVGVAGSRPREGVAVEKEEAPALPAACPEGAAAELAPKLGAYEGPLPGWPVGSAGPALPPRLVAVGPETVAEVEIGSVGMDCVFMVREEGEMSK